MPSLSPANPSFGFKKNFALFLASTVVCLTAATSANGQFADTTPPPENLSTGFDSITQAQAKEWLGILAGPKFEGRGTGQPGYAKAAHWVAGKLAEFGLEPVGDNGTYFQMLPMKRRLPVIEECFLECSDGTKIPAKNQLGFERYTDQQEIMGKVVFIRFGGDTELPGEVELRDKIVLYTADEAASRSAQTRLVRKRPAAFLRIIESNPNSIPQLIRKGGRTRSTSVSGTIIESATHQLIESCGETAQWFNGDFEGIKVYEPDNQIRLRMRFQEEQAAVPNVVAWLEGSDPTLKNEYVVLGSHLDHLGIRGGKVHPGADDNGSGSTAVLSIAKAFSVNPVRPKRSVLFIWFAAEEMGLIGSRHYTNNPTLPLDGMTCMFNIDMVGRNEETPNETSEDNEGAIHLVGSQKGDNELHTLILKANQHVGFRFELDEEKVWNRSDQINFYEKGVPVAFLFGGFHPDYHRPGDQVQKINFLKLTSAARLYYLAVNRASEHGRFQANPSQSETEK